MISIIIPTFNRIDSLQKCVDSVISQAYDGLELIIIDDFSQDVTKPFLLKLAANHIYVKVHFNDINHGVNYSRNRGIEMATKEFILFLDSDDELEQGSLLQVRNTLMANPDTNHFLFLVSDREKEFSGTTRIKTIQYPDWVTGKVSGDFTHVILTAIMKKYLFFEEFRMFEHLNWLRVKKETSPQLLVPIITARRDRHRSDSLITSSKLQSFDVIRDKFQSEKFFYSMYHKDLKLYNPGSLSYPLLKTIFLGVACGHKHDCKTLIPYAGKMHIKLLSGLVMLLPSSLLRYGVISYSNSKSR
ncbi:MAG: glycosyltransferase family A protein [Chitinophagaceae bacterium]